MKGLQILISGFKNHSHVDTSPDLIHGGTASSSLWQNHTRCVYFALVCVCVFVCTAEQSRRSGSESPYLRMTDSSFCISQHAGELCDSSTHTRTPTHSALRQGAVQLQGCVKLHAPLNATPNFAAQWKSALFYSPPKIQLGLPFPHLAAESLSSLFLYSRFSPEQRQARAEVRFQQQILS